MNQISPLPPSVKNVYWTKKWYEFWKKAVESGNKKFRICVLTCDSVMHYMYYRVCMFKNGVSQKMG